MNIGESTPQEPLMTAEQVAAYLQISPSMVYKLRREGRLAGVAVGALWRWHPEVVRAFARGEFASVGAAPVVPISQRRRRV